MLAQPESTTLAYPSSATHAQFIAALRLSLRLSNSSSLLNTGRTRPLLQTAKSSTSASPQLADEWWDRSRLGEEEERIDASEGGEEKRGWFGAWSRRTSAQPVSARAGSVDVGGSKPTGMAEKLPPTVVPPSRPSSTVASSSRPSIDHASSPALPAQQTAPTSAQAPPSPSLSLGLESPVPIAAEAAEPTDTAAASAAPAPSAVSRFLGRFSRKATAAAAAATPTQAEQRTTGSRLTRVTFSRVLASPSSLAASKQHSTTSSAQSRAPPCQSRWHRRQAGPLRGRARPPRSLAARDDLRHLRPLMTFPSYRSTARRRLLRCRPAPLNLRRYPPRRLRLPTSGTTSWPVLLVAAQRTPQSRRSTSPLRRSRSSPRHWLHPGRPRRPMPSPRRQPREQRPACLLSSLHRPSCLCRPPAITSTRTTTLATLAKRPRRPSRRPRRAVTAPALSLAAALTTLPTSSRRRLPLLAWQPSSRPHGCSQALRSEPSRPRPHRNL